MSKHCSDSKSRKSKKADALHRDLARDVALDKINPKRERHLQHHRDRMAGLN